MLYLFALNQIGEVQVFKDVKILHFKDLTAPFGGFAAEEDAHR